MIAGNLVRLGIWVGWEFGLAAQRIGDTGRFKLVTVFGAFLIPLHLVGTSLSIALPANTNHQARFMNVRVPVFRLSTMQKPFVDLLRWAAIVASLFAVGFSESPANAQSQNRQPTPKQTDAAWRPLLTDTFDGWVTHIGVPHKSVTVPGRPASTSEDGKTGTPIGSSDPLKIYSIEQVDGEPVLHISGQVFGGLSTEEMFGDYHLSFQYKWGDKKWPPRMERKRDSGVLIHCTGPQGAMWNVWMRSLECQVQETDTGDLYALAGTSTCVPSLVAPNQPKTYQPGGKVHCIGAGGGGAVVKRSENHEAVDDWNQVDIMAVGDEAVYKVNGNVVMHLQNAKIGSQATGKTLTRGHIQIQSEGAEVFYRRIQIRPLKTLPAMEATSPQ